MTPPPITITGFSIESPIKAGAHYGQASPTGKPQCELCLIFATYRAAMLVFGSLTAPKM
jgi:hypothetical protein